MWKLWQKSNSRSPVTTACLWRKEVVKGGRSGVAGHCGNNMTTRKWGRTPWSWEAGRLSFWDPKCLHVSIVCVSTPHSWCLGRGRWLGSEGCHWSLNSLPAGKAQHGSKRPGVVHVDMPTRASPSVLPSSPKPQLNNSASCHGKHSQSVSSGPGNVLSTAYELTHLILPTIRGKVETEAQSCDPMKSCVLADPSVNLLPTPTPHHFKVRINQTADSLQSGITFLAHFWCSRLNFSHSGHIGQGSAEGISGQSNANPKSTGRHVQLGAATLALSPVWVYYSLRPVRWGW